MKIAILPEQVTVYRVRYHGPGKVRRYQNFTSRDKAIERVAWWMIFDKYNEFVEVGEWLPGMPEIEQKRKPPLNCSCTRSEYEPEWVGCPLHDRETGYYARLHERVVRMLKRGATNGT